MVAKIARYQHSVAGLGCSAIDLPVFWDPTDPGCIDEQAINLAFFSDLCVPRDDLDASFLRCCDHTFSNLFKFNDWEAFFDDESSGEKERDSA